jgi:aminoglycoside 6'-N-acetyltransferase I
VGHDSARLFEELDDDPDRSGDARPLGPLTVRYAISEDAEAMGRLSADREGGDAAAHVAGCRRAIERCRMGRTSLVLVAESEHGIIGFGKVKHLSEERPDGGGVTPEGWYLTGVVVDPRFRRRGVGARLTEVRLQWISERSRFAYYFSNARNPVSIALHERFGFIEVARGSAFGGVSFVGGEGILFRADLTRIAGRPA